MTALAFIADQRRLRSWWSLHPESPYLAAVAVSWVALVIAHWVSHGQAEAAWSFHVGSWTAMVVAMMAPGILPMQRWVTFHSLWDRRQRASALFVGTYVAAWVLLGVLAAVGVWAVERASGLRFEPNRWVVAATLGVAALWQFTPLKRRSLRRCHLRLPLAPSGRAADRSVIAYGWFQARACIGSCGPAMAAMFVAAHDFHLMIPLAVILLHERFQTRPHEAAGAAGLVAVALLALV